MIAATGIMDLPERRRLDEHTQIHETVYRLGIKTAFKAIGAIGIVLILGISALHHHLS
jgi:hypothetical protein